MHTVQDLLNPMARLRDPQFGRPWDLKQTYALIVPPTLEQAHAVA
ncbi:nucleoside triphosphate pyrophosphohydrolase, partial [Pseudomonas syringae]